MTTFVSRQFQQKLRENSCTTIAASSKNIYYDIANKTFYQTVIKDIKMFFQMRLESSCCFMTVATFVFHLSSSAKPVIKSLFLTHAQWKYVVNKRCRGQNTQLSDPVCSSSLLLLRFTLASTLWALTFHPRREWRVYHWTYKSTHTTLAQETTT